MSVTLTTRGNRLCVEIPDHKGEVWTYAVEVVSNNDLRFAVKLQKLDDPDENVYLVEIGPRWHRCDCPSFKYRPAVRAEGCKHVRDCRQLRPLLGLLPAIAQPQEKRA